MRQIIKSEPAEFSDFIRRERPTEWNDIAPIRENIRAHMLENEQNDQCAYTEIRIEKGKSYSHIDHFRKQSIFPALKFSYSNLFTAHLAEDFGAKHKDDVVRSSSDYDNLLSPLAPDLSDHFTFDVATGEIETSTIQGKYTTDIFNLNHPTLVERRKIAALSAVTYKDQFPVEDTIEFIGEFENLIRYIYNV